MVLIFTTKTCFWAFLLLLVWNKMKWIIKMGYYHWHAKRMVRYSKKKIVKCLNCKLCFLFFCFLFFQVYILIENMSSNQGTCLQNTCNLPITWRRHVLSVLLLFPFRGCHSIYKFLTNQICGCRSINGKWKTFKFKVKWNIKTVKLKVKWIPFFARKHH